MKSITILLLLLVIFLSGCSSTLRCGVDGDASYVDLINVRDLPANARYYRDLCAFSYEGDQDETT